MLAQNFKAPADLDLTPIEFEALVTVLGMLERGELVHGKYPLSRMRREPNEFNMSIALETGDESQHNRGCGTVGCLMGWAYVVSGRVAFGYVPFGEDQCFDRLPARLIELFGIGQPVSVLNQITPEHAARVLREFLTTGKANWWAI